MLSVVDQDRPHLISVVIVLNTADCKARLMRVVAPLGVLLPPGISLRIDNADAGRLSSRNVFRTAAWPSSRWTKP